MSYTNGLDDSSAHFQSTLYTGNATADTAITNSGNSDLQPDWIWIKRRDGSADHNSFDSSRGTGKHLAQNQTQGENTVNGVTAFNTDGFTLSTNGDSNFNGGTFVAWQWKANGGTKGTNSDGSTDATVQVNQDAGFSIVEFTTDGGNETYGHGLGVKPDIVIVKSRSGGGSWIYMTDVIDGSVDYLLLNDSNAAADLSYGAFTSSTFQYNDNNAVTQIAYCFSEKQGYSKFSSYVGNGEGLNGPFVYTGFSPAWVMIKNASRTDRPWYMFDNKRRTFNANGTMLEADTPDAEATDQAIDMLSNGFKVRPSALGSYGTSSTNHSGETLIYMAFAENPFVTSTGIPTTAR